MRRFSPTWLFQLRSLAPQSASVVVLPSGHWAMPASCANCGGVPTEIERVAARHKTVLVPYCEWCFGRLLRLGTRQMAATLASVLASVTLLLTLPWVFPHWGLFEYIGVATIAAALPPILVSVVRRAESPPQTSDGRAVWWVGPAALCCTREGFARDVAELNQAQRTTASVRPPVQRPMMWLGVAIACVFGPATYNFLHPQLWVLNLAAAEFELYSETAALGRVPASSLESPEAGLRLRLGVGGRELRAVDHTGKVVASRRVSIAAGKSYLYAPLSEGHCFWLERERYGRAEAATQGSAHLRLLPPDRDFWAMPSDIDNWFAKNPAPARDTRSSGGSLTALRLARCTDAPESVRPP